MSKRTKHYGLDQPLKLNDHGRPKTRREFLAQGFTAGLGSVMGTSTLGSLLSANAFGLSQDLEDRRIPCGIVAGAGKIPFIAFDLAGGVNVAGSNVLVGGRGGQLDFLSTGGYSKQGLPGDMVPGVAEPMADPDGVIGDHTDNTLGLYFHSDSQFLAGILERTSAATQAAVNGAVIAARSENDTGNNPHNPMYAINMAGARGQLLSLIGSRASVSGGNSVAPMSLINNEVRPTKVDRPSDVTGLVDVGDFGTLSDAQVVSVMESVSRMSDSKLGAVNTRKMNDAAIKELISCAYIKSAFLAETFPNPAVLDPAADTDIVGGADSIFTAEEFNGDREFQKTASVMKLVCNGFAGAGTITMGGYDYHTGDRATGEIRDLRAGRCMGACLEYAARVGKPLMIYVYSDGSVFSNGTLDNSVEGRGKGVWTGDNQQTASSFFLVYNPGGRPQLISAANQQIGFMRASGDVETSSSPVANNVNLLVNAVLLNYMALHGEQGNFEQLFTSRQLSHGLGNAAMMDSLTAFTPIVNGTITNPV